MENLPIKKPTLLDWGILSALALVWGSSFILMKVANKTFSGVELAELRVLITGLFFVPILLAQRKNLPANRSDWGLGLIAGLLGSFFPAFLFGQAIEHMDSSVVGILNSFTPIFGLLIGGMFFGMMILKRQVVGMLIGAAGCVLIAITGKSGEVAINAYALLVVLATVFYGINLHVINKFLRHIKPLVLTGVTFITVAPIAGGLLLTSDFSQKFNHPSFAISMAAVITLGVIGSGIAMILFNYILQKTNPVFASMVTYLIPVISVLWGLFADEALHPQHFIGMAVILVGVYLVNKKG